MVNGTSYGGLVVAPGVVVVNRMSYGGCTVFTV